LSFLSPIVGSPASRFEVRNDRTGDVLATSVEAALDSASRRRGLLGRRSFARGSALLIAPTSAVHTFFMHFAIDLVFVAKDGTVKKTYSSLPPWRIGFALGAFAVVELPAGTVSSGDTKRGDALRLVAIEPAPRSRD
jgi:uncharacterized membrane protein (UPF0127 family)